MMLVILCLLVFFEMFPLARPTCADACTCRWKNGKQSVECRHKGLITIPDGVHPSTQVIDLTHNSLNHLPADVFSDANLLNLQEIYLRSCHLRQVDPLAFSHLSNLIEIDLSENRLKEVPSRSFEPTFQLRELNLRRNPLRRILSEDFQFTPSLKRLDLSFCLISSVAFDAFEPIENLLHLKMQGNKLSLLHSRVINSLRRLHEVEIYENPWTCDCRSRPFRKWTQTIPHSQSPTCETPARLRGRFVDSLSLDDFACPPQTHPTRQVMDSEIGGNSSLWCPVTGVPSPSVSWLINGHLIMNGTLLTKRGARAFIIDVSHEDQGSVLVVIGRSSDENDEISSESLDSVDGDDSHLKIRCIASNPAGAVSISFTLSFYHPTIFGRFSDDTMKVVVLLLAVSIFCVIIATVFIALFRRRSRIPASSISDQYDGFSTIPYDTAYTDGSLITNEEPPSVTLNKYDYGQDDVKSNPEMVIWAPERALAALDSAAPEHVIHASSEKDLPPACRALLAPRHNNIYGSQKRLSYLPDFAPNFLEPYQFEQVTPDGRALSQCQTLPKTLRVKTFSMTDESLVTSTLPHNLWTSSCRRYSQPIHEDVPDMNEISYRRTLPKDTHDFRDDDEE